MKKSSFNVADWVSVWCAPFWKGNIQKQKITMGEYTANDRTKKGRCLKNKKREIQMVVGTIIP